MYYGTIDCIAIYITCGSSTINTFILYCMSITFVLCKLCIRIILVHTTWYLISSVCLFVRPLEGRTLFYLYFVIGFCYNTGNIKLIPSWFPSIPPPGNYLFLLDCCTPFKPSLGLSDKQSNERQRKFDD